jgi:imidazolonepropionase-like amidohydrolase
MRRLLSSTMWVGALVVGACMPAGESPVALSADLALVDVQVVDVVAGQVLPAMTVLIADGRITTVAGSAEVEVAAEVQIIDGAGRFLIPGLWDMHVHTLWDPSIEDTFLPLFIANGVTGVRDMGGIPSLTRSWPQKIEEGELLGPRVVAAGPILDGDPPLHAGVSVGVDGPEAAREALRTVRSEGYDFAKVYTLLSRESYFAIAEEAGRLDFPFAGHPSGYVTPLEASEAGQLSIEHLAHGQPDPGFFDLACVDADGCAALLEAFVRNGTWQVPTLVMLRAKAYSEEPAYGEDPRLRFVPEMVRADYLSARKRRMDEGTPERVAERRHDWERHLRLVRAMDEAGVPLAAGTDTGVLFSLPGFSLHDELALFVEAGLSPAAALRAATSAAATLAGLRNETGRVAEGLAADLVLLRANPLEDIRSTTAIDGVVRAGRWIGSNELVRMLEAVEKAASP